MFLSVNRMPLGCLLLALLCISSSKATDVTDDDIMRMVTWALRDRNSVLLRNAPEFQLR